MRYPALVLLYFYEYEYTSIVSGPIPTGIGIGASLIYIYNESKINILNISYLKSAMITDAMAILITMSNEMRA